MAFNKPISWFKLYEAIKQDPRAVILSAPKETTNVTYIQVSFKVDGSTYSQITVGGSDGVVLKIGPSVQTPKERAEINKGNDKITICVSDMSSVEFAEFVKLLTENVMDQIDGLLESGTLATDNTKKIKPRLEKYGNKTKKADKKGKIRDKEQQCSIFSLPFDPKTGKLKEKYYGIFDVQEPLIKQKKIKGQTTEIKTYDVLKGEDGTELTMSNVHTRFTSGSKLAMMIFNASVMSHAQGISFKLETNKIYLDQVEFDNDEEAMELSQAYVSDHQPSESEPKFHAQSSADSDKNNANDDPADESDGDDDTQGGDDLDM